MFDVQGAMSAGMIAAWLRRPEGRLSKETHQAGDLPADFEVESLHDVTRIIELNRGA
jgi:FMN phosphatase YigB (HAD superfamily)